MFYALSGHHYITKFQTEYFKHRMASLTSDEYDTILCFAENYSFVVQNAVHSFYWNNSQAIINLFVMYCQKQFYSS